MDASTYTFNGTLAIITLLHAHCIQRVFPNLVPSLHSHPHKRQGAPLPPTQEPLPPTQEAGGSTLIYTRAWGSTPIHTRATPTHARATPSLGVRLGLPSHMWN